MLDAYIIDAIRRQERVDDERGRIWLELPVDSGVPTTPDVDPEADVFIIPIGDPEKTPEDEAA